MESIFCIADIFKLNISKSSGTTSVEVKWNVYINYRPITTKLTAQVFRPGVVGHVPHKE